MRNLPAYLAKQERTVPLGKHFLNVFRLIPELAARQIESWAFWFAREMVETLNEMWRVSER